MRQADRQTDRLKTKRQLRQNITQEAIMTYLEMLKPGYQKKTGERWKLQLRYTKVRKSPPAMNLPKPVMS